MELRWEDVGRDGDEDGGRRKDGRAIPARVDLICLADTVGASRVCDDVIPSVLRRGHLPQAATRSRPIRESSLPMCFRLRATARETGTKLGVRGPPHSLSLNRPYRFPLRPTQATLFRFRVLGSPSYRSRSPAFTTILRTRPDLLQISLSFWHYGTPSHAPRPRTRRVSSISSPGRLFDGTAVNCIMSHFSMSGQYVICEKSAGLDVSAQARYNTLVPQLGILAIHFVKV